MSGDDSTSTYAPKSPDLSSFYSSGPTQPASQIHTPSQSSGQYKLHPPAYTYGSSYVPPMQLSALPQQQIDSEFSSYSLPLQQYYSPPSQSSHQVHAQSTYLLQAPPFHQPQPSQSYHSHIQHQEPPQFQSALPPESSRTSGLYSSEMPPRRAAAAPPAPMIEPSPVKTKFPTARIKRIMQADEEVGKVAQQTPIAVGKALELFMIQLVSRSAEVAKEKGSKRVTAPMLKQVVETDDQWDFLREIVGRVENEREGSRSKARAESESDEDSEPKKKGRRGRSKKV